MEAHSAAKNPARPDQGVQEIRTSASPMTDELNSPTSFDTEPEKTRLTPAAPVIEPGEPSDFELMRQIQEENPEALSKLYDRYNGILKALILRVIHNESEAD